jgi:hypothetical protein
MKINHATFFYKPNGTPNSFAVSLVCLKTDEFGFRKPIQLNQLQMLGALAPEMRAGQFELPVLE